MIKAYRVIRRGSSILPGGSGYFRKTNNSDKKKKREGK